jgi:hypothetical protein
LLIVSRSFMNVANSVLWRMIILKANKVNLYLHFVFWYSTIHRAFRHTTYIWKTERERERERKLTFGRRTLLTDRKYRAEKAVEFIMIELRMTMTCVWRGCCTVYSDRRP